MYEPDDDGERAVHDQLVALVDGNTPAAADDEAPEEGTERARDWLDDILDGDSKPPAADSPAPEPADEPATDTPAPKAAPAKKKQAKKRKRRKPAAPGTPRSAFDTRPPSPRQSLIEAWDRVPYRLKWLAYHATAAYLGWSIGLVGWATYVTAWIADGHLTSAQAVFWYVAGAVVLLLHHRTRTWWRPVAWLAAVPLSSTVVGVLLYGTPHP